MFSLVNILIVFFLFLIIYQLFLANRVIEGLSNSDSSDSSDSNSTAILAQKNAAEIQIINEHLLDPVNQQISTINTTLTSLQNQINQLATSIQQMSQNMPGQQQLTSGTTTSGTTTSGTTTSGTTTSGTTRSS